MTFHKNMPSFVNNPQANRTDLESNQQSEQQVNQNQVQPGQNGRQSVFKSASVGIRVNNQKVCSLIARYPSDQLLRFSMPEAMQTNPSADGHKSFKEIMSQDPYGLNMEGIFDTDESDSETETPAIRDERKSSDSRSSSESERARSNDTNAPPQKKAKTISHWNDLLRAQANPTRSTVGHVLHEIANGKLNETHYITRKSLYRYGKELDFRDIASIEGILTRPGVGVLQRVPGGYKVKPQAAAIIKNNPELNWLQENHERLSRSLGTGLPFNLEQYKMLEILKEIEPGL